MLSIHNYELVHQEPVPNTGEVLLLFYDQMKGGNFFVLAPAKWYLEHVLPVLVNKRKHTKAVAK